MPRILCIEDEPVIRAELVEELQDAGYETIEAANGQEGLELIKKHKPDLVVSDITMPVMDGHELLAELRKEGHQQADLPFIFLSALADRDHIVAGKKLGADDYLTKPIDLDLFMATVEARLDQVRRSNEKKEGQLLKLYKALSDNQEQASASSGLEGGSADGAQAAKTPEPTGGGAPGQVPAPENLTQTIEKSGGKLVAGRLQMVGLESLRDELGERWEKVAERVRNVSERVIKRRLAEHDTYSFSEAGTSFVICFRDLNEKEAWFTAKSIEDDIRQKVLGSEAGSSLADLVETELLPRISETEVEARTVQLDKDTIDTADDLYDLVLGKITEQAAIVEETCVTLLTELQQHPELSFSTILNSSRKKIPLSLGMFASEGKKTAARLVEMAPADPKMLRNIDALLLSAASSCMIQDSTQPEGTVLIGVCFSTLDGGQNSHSYPCLLKQLPELVKSRLGLVVSQMPKHLPTSRMLSALGGVASLCRIFALEFEVLDLGALDLKELRCKVVCIPYRLVSASTSGAKAAAVRFCDSVHSHGAKVLVRDVPQNVVLDITKSMPVDFVSSV